MGLPLSTLSLSDFLAWEAPQETRHEFFRSEIFAMTGGSARHRR